MRHGCYTGGLLALGLVAGCLARDPAERRFSDTGLGTSEPAPAPESDGPSGSDPEPDDQPAANDQPVVGDEPGGGDAGVGGSSDMGGNAGSGGTAGSAGAGGSAGSAGAGGSAGSAGAGGTAGSAGAGGAGGSGGDEPEPEAWSSVSVGADFACGVTTQGRAFCWGNLQGGDAASASPVPVELPGLTNVRKIAAGAYNSCATLADGTAHCWGIFLPLAGIVSGPMPQPMPLSNVDTLVTTLELGCALLGNRSVACIDVTTSTPQPLAELGPVRAIDGTLTSSNHYCAVTQNGSIACWGDDGYMAQMHGALSGMNRTPFILPELDAVGATQVAVGDSHTCALVNSQVLCWGDNGLGQLGTGVLDETFTFVGPTQVPDLRAIAVDAGASTTCAVLEDRTVRCWGFLGQNPQPAPLPILGLTDVASVSVGFNSACAVKTDGTAWCFGDNRSGQLGNPDARDILSYREDFLGPVQVILPASPGAN
jgi:hypothetical protein